MAGKTFGIGGGFWAVGLVLNHLDDPTQSGMIKVQWQMGSAVQDQLKEEQLPWSKVMHPTTDSGVDKTGGPHTGIRKGATVLGVNLSGDGQDYIVVGVLRSAGSGKPDEQFTFDSSIPFGAKVATNGKVDQPRKGDINGIVTQQSIVKYAETDGGGGAAKYAQLDDSVGVTKQIFT